MTDTGVFNILRKRTCSMVKFFPELTRYGVMKGSPGLIDDINPKKHRNITCHFHVLVSLAS